MEELDPYRDMPPLPQSEGSVIPLLDFDEADEEGASMDAYPNHGAYRAMGRTEGVGGDMGETRKLQGQGEGRSAQVSSSSLACIEFGISTQVDPAVKADAHALQFARWPRITWTAVMNEIYHKRVLSVASSFCTRFSHCSAKRRLMSLAGRDSATLSGCCFTARRPY